MKFQCNTKPLSEALNLSIINSNISNFHKKSTVAQITASKRSLRINVESSRICSEAVVSGSGDSDERSTIFVSSALIKQLVSTLDSNTVELEFADNGLTFYSGKSKFTLPKMIDESELDLQAPAYSDSEESIDIDKSSWKFIKDYQMYAIAMSFIHPVYTRVWIGESGDVLVGDFDNSLFTLSHKGKLGSTCLLSDTIINLFNSLPDGCKLVKVGDSYIIHYVCDSFAYRSQFMPQYESDEEVGSYNSDIFLSMMSHPADGMKVSASVLSKFLNQATLLSSSTEDTIDMAVNGNELHFQDKNVDCVITYEGIPYPSFSITFKLESLKQVISNYGDDNINIYPLVQGDEYTGVLIWNDDLTTVLAGVE